MSANPTFQHRHYAAIAATIMSATPLARDGSEAMRQWHRTVTALCQAFQRDNERFDTERFVAACNGTPTNAKDRR